ncbi:hypothetical protein C1141_05615 [Vibrio agarivorans]|uniref:Uncharacterized protein n=1 Tax=Vibrio sagamiensis NBRC 104589 TaxID=1219064 RepID=A0A511QFK2_9VIBR|nr:hypothetical protein C1141_05615 [Vibrio agarivorans]GEM75936.1 hypothetical protein VSA01S_20480 [Vibrio sagamiensis NBRC 104589]
MNTKSFYFIAYLAEICIQDKYLANNLMKVNVEKLKAPKRLSMFHNRISIIIDNLQKVDGIRKCFYQKATQVTQLN